MRFICSDADCVGCSACQNICTKNCISMVRNSEGFLYPKINNNSCVRCGLCGKVCPIINNEADSGIIPTTFGAFSINEANRMASSSGGVFMLLGESIINRGGVVVGPIFDENFNVVHHVSSSLEELKLMRGSKYVQSDLGNIYSLIEQELIDGKEVLFSGTPCQVSGLKSYLRKDYVNLYAQDIVCHGIPSPMIWNKYISFLEKKYDSKVLAFNFRCKDNGWSSYSIKVTLENGMVISEPAKDNMYFLSYMMGMHFRKCCSNCKFKKIHYVSDLTLGDLWGITDIKPSINDDKGTSLIMVHTEKGQRMLDKIKSNLSLFPVEYSAAIKYNKSIIESSKHSSVRNNFLKDAIKIDFKKLFKKYCGMSFFSRIRRKINGVFSK